MRNQEIKQVGKFDSFEEMFQRAEERTGYWVELAKLDFTEDMLARMKERDVNKSQLASRLGVPPGLVTKLASGQNNFTIQTMVRIARALDSQFRCHLQPVGTKTSWIDLLKEEPQRDAVEGWDPAGFQRVPFQPTTLTYEPVPAAA